MANPYLWSTTAATNSAADPTINLAEGQVPGSLNDSGRSIMGGIAQFLKDINGTTTTGGSGSAYTITAPNITHASLVTGIITGFKASATNAASATLNYNSHGAKSIRIYTRAGEVAIPAGAILSGGHYLARYDTVVNAASGGWVLLNPTETALAYGYVVWTQILQSTGTVSAGTTAFFGTGTASTAEGDVRFKFRKACIVDGFSIVCSTPPAGGQTFIYTLRKNGADTALTLTLTGATGEGLTSGNPITFAAGDIAALKLVTSASAAVARHNATLDFILA